MSRQLVFVHGRSQQRKDSIALKAEWIEALGKGLASSGLSLPIAEPDVRFPYYGDALSDLVGGKSPADAAEIVVRGVDAGAEEKAFMLAIAREIQEKQGISDAEVAQEISAVHGDVIQRGPMNWEWFQGVLRAIDRVVPGGSGASVSLFTRDVFQYLRNPAIRDTIEAGVMAAIKPGVETVVVSHSLGTVVAYNLLRREGRARGWTIPLFITLGSPLAVEVIRKTLRGFATLGRPECARSWFNAMDERDVVALYPLTPAHFPISPAAPAIENMTSVRNSTENHHGIAGYLDDPEVARRIHAALL